MCYSLFLREHYWFSRTRLAISKLVQKLPFVTIIIAYAEGRIVGENKSKRRNVQYAIG
jgi:hypothetical protein